MKQDLVLPESQGLVTHQEGRVLPEVRRHLRLFGTKHLGTCMHVGMSGQACVYACVLYVYVNVLHVCMYMYASAYMYYATNGPNISGVTKCPPEADPTTPYLHKHWHQCSWCFPGSSW